MRPCTNLPHFLPIDHDVVRAVTGHIAGDPETCILRCVDGGRLWLSSLSDWMPCIERQPELVGWDGEVGEVAEARSSPEDLSGYSHASREDNPSPRTPHVAVKEWPLPPFFLEMK